MSYFVTSVVISILLVSDIDDRNKLPPEAVDTAELILILDELFDSLNSNNRLAPSGKPLKGGVNKNSSHLGFWKKSVEVLESMKYFSRKKQCLVTVPSLKNLIFTIKGFMRLTTKLLHEYQFKYILTRAFNQDPLEKFFWGH